MSARQPLADIQSAKDQGASATRTGPAPFGLSPASGSQAEPLVPSAVVRVMLADLDFSQCEECEGTGVVDSGRTCFRCDGVGTLPEWGDGL